ncbi:MAG: 3-methyl-2-oxobutanoate hydroxymethyltransferase [Gemmatimonas sp.]
MSPASPVQTPAATSAMKARIEALRNHAASHPPLVMLTAYDAVSARLVDEAGVDLVLVGDSAATTVLGYEFTREIQREELLMLTRAARRGVQRALLVGDLPHGTYESSDDEAVATAREFMAAGCDLVKLEGAGVRLARVAAIIRDGIPVVGHVGLLPQSAQTQNDLRARGRSADDATAVLRDAIALEDAGCSALVIEAVPSVVAAAVAERLRIPVIGIGAGPNVDGQVLVFHDMLGLTHGHVPKFVRQYGTAGESLVTSIRQYADDVRARAFPNESEGYGMPAAERAAFEAQIQDVRR